MTNTTLTVINGTIDMGNSALSQSTLSVTNGDACFDTCEFVATNTTFVTSNADYQNSTLTGSTTTTSNSGLSIIDGNYINSNELNSDVLVTGGQLTIRSTAMSSTLDSQAYVTIIDASVNISDACEFTRYRIDCDNQGVSNAVQISDSIIQNNANCSGISLSSVVNYCISGNVITHNQIGISLLYSGTGSQKEVKYNVIENNSTHGIRIVGSKVSITGHNEIQQNNYGVSASNFSSWSMIGRECSPNGEYQLLQYNNVNQILMTYDSAPDYLAYNCIQNSNHNTPWVRVIYPSLSEKIRPLHNHIRP